MEDIQNQSEQTKILIRHTDPQRLDSASYGQIWKVINEDGGCSIWVQLSKFEAEPCWIPITFYFDENFQELLKDETFQETLQTLF